MFDLCSRRESTHYNSELGPGHTPERCRPIPGQTGHSPQRHTAAGTAASTTTDTGNTVPQRANPTQFIRMFPYLERVLPFVVSLIGMWVV